MVLQQHELHDARLDRRARHRKAVRRCASPSASSAVRACDRSRQCPSIQTAHQTRRADTSGRTTSTCALAAGEHELDSTATAGCAATRRISRGGRGYCRPGQIISAAMLYERMIAPTRLTDGSCRLTTASRLSLAAAGQCAQDRAQRRDARFLGVGGLLPDTETTVVVLVESRRCANGSDRTRHGAARDRRARSRIEPARQLSPAQRQRVIGTYNIGVFDTRVVDRRRPATGSRCPRPGPTFRASATSGEAAGCRTMTDPDATALYFDDDDRPVERS